MSKIAIFAVASGHLLVLGIFVTAILCLNTTIFSFLRIRGGRTLDDGTSVPLSPDDERLTWIAFKQGVLGFLSFMLLTVLSAWAVSALQNHLMGACFTW